MGKPNLIGNLAWVVAAFVVSGTLQADTKVGQRSASSDSSVRLPILGFAVRAPLELRPILGSAEASGLGLPLALPSGATAVMAAPGQRYVLAVLDQIAVARLGPDGLGPLNPISGTMANVERVDFSPSGSAAVLYSRSSQRLQVLAGLPDSPSLVMDVDTTSWAATLTSAAVCDDAAVVLVGASAGDNTLLAMLGSAGQLNAIANVSSISAIRFMVQTHDAVAVDSQRNQVLFLKAGQDASYSARVLGGDAQGLSAPSDVELSTDGSRVYVANSGTNAISIVEIATGNSQSLNCDFALAGFQRLTGSVVRVTGQNTNSVWVLDTDAVSPQISFVPTLP
jgi:hypothetical protein